MKLSDDATKVKLSINDILTAAQIETLIADLAELRAKMSPAVPDTLPKPGTPGSDLPNLHTHDDPEATFRLLRNGGIRLLLRSDGLGWMLFNFSAANACVMRDWLVANTVQMERGPNLFSDEIGEGNQPH